MTDDCPYEYKGICMNSNSLFFDEKCIPGKCFVYGNLQIASKKNMLIEK
jgi:hypothetical protein